MKRSNFLIWIIPFILTSLGILVILSLTSVKGGDNPLSFGVASRQFQWFIIAWGGMLAIYIVPLYFWKNMSGIFLILSWIMVWLPLVPGLGVGGGGAVRWFKIGSLTVQPLEMLAFFLTLHLSKIYSRGKMERGRAFFLTVFMLIIIVFPVMKQPDFGGALFLIVLSMGIYIGAFGFLFPSLLGIAMVPVFSYAVQLEYRMRRIIAWLDPWSDPKDIGYQTIQSLSAFANGGLWGTGLGKAVQRSRFLPAAHTDYIFAVSAETLGLLGSLGIIGLYVIWFLYLFIKFTSISDLWHRSLIWGLSLSVAVPVFINIGGITNLIPMTGMPLPFMSYGGSSLVVNWLKVGIILRILKESEMTG